MIQREVIVMISKNRQWGEALRTILKDTQAEIPCPECGKGLLGIDDILDDAGDIYQRGLMCPNCGEKRYLLSAYGIFEEIID